ncbi:hypothetical protein QR680_008899 [Steinernema hermaphroditum]|uniref:Peptidase M13 C-terminal domain-containing protein n=1 Tax=Steinernema hermaphroditum TaxID=289476 RepID=A0AA39IK78_9BILA|nr:hypothetical protein QR680_008899 [Steinernema hermaphroditum]
MRSLLFTFVAFLPYSFGAPVDTEGGGASDGFKEAARFLSEALDTSVDPCEDFYNFTCGNFAKFNPLPEGRAIWRRAEIAVSEINPKFKAVFEDSERYGSKAMNLMKDIYHKCVDTATLGEKKSAELLEKMREMGGYPTLVGPHWDDPNFDLTALLIASAKAEPEIFFYVQTTDDERNVEKPILQIKQGSPYPLFEMYEHFYLDDLQSKNFAAIREFMTDKIRKLKEDSLQQGETVDMAVVEADVEAFLQFEKTMATAANSLPNTPQIMRLSELDLLLPEIDWKAYFLALAPESVHAYISSDPEISVEKPAYVARLGEIIRNTPKRTLANYVHWKLLRSWIMKKQLDKRFDTVNIGYVALSWSRFFERERWTDCVEILNSRFFLKHVSSAFYARKYFSGDQKKAFEDLYRRVKKAFRGTLENSWMDEKTKAAALRKLDKMGAELAYPDFVLDDAALDEFYKKVIEIFDENDSYPAMIQKVQAWEMQRKFEELTESANPEDYRFNAGFLNAAMTFEKNRIAFPAGYIQAPFYRSDFPAAMNFGGVGSILGHEMAHGFDTKGSLFDEKGNKRNWWTKKAKEGFENRTSCMVRQYSQYDVPGTKLKLDGAKIVSENMADMEGIKQAYIAYMEHMEKIGGEPRIPGFETFSNDQMFFIANGISTCTAITPEGAIANARGSHPDMRIRSYGPARNIREFAKAFGCSRGQFMNPPDSERCMVWERI